MNAWMTQNTKGMLIDFSVLESLWQGERELDWVISSRFYWLEF